MRKEGRGSLYTMATGTGPGLTEPADHSPHELGEDDLRVVLRVLHPVAEKYKFLGVEMNVKMNEIKKIQRQFSDPDECLLEVLSVRLKQIPSLTWRDIDTALRSGPVGEPQLADRIRRQYGHLYGLHPCIQESPLGKNQTTIMSQMTINKKKEESARTSIQEQHFVEKVSESKRYRKPSEKVQMDISEVVVKKTWQNPSYTKRHSKAEKKYERETQYEGKTQRKRRVTNNKSESETSIPSSEQHISKANSSDSTEESYSSGKEDSAEKVSEMERKQKLSAKPREDLNLHSHREILVTKVKEKSGNFPTFLSEDKSIVYESRSTHEGREKQMKKTLEQSDSINESKYETIVEEKNSDMSDIEEQQDDTPIRKTGRRTRVHSDNPSASSPTTHRGTQSDSKYKRRETTKHQTHIKRVKHQKSSSSSETDDDSSSQECDLLRNLSESENKALIKAFKCCFGKLCLAIKDPEKAAAELQARHLLSCSMVETLLTSPESQQMKAIALVRALKKRIKLHPVRVFTIIEVFLQNEILKEAGRELWNEAGIQISPFQTKFTLS